MVGGFRGLVMSTTYTETNIDQNSRFWVVPERHPDQRILPRDQRDVVIASEMGAVWEPDLRFMVPGPEASPENMKRLSRRFGTVTARRKVQSALSDLAANPVSHDEARPAVRAPAAESKEASAKLDDQPEQNDGIGVGEAAEPAARGGDRILMAEAANEEVRRRGGTPAREVPTASERQGERVYFYTDNIPDSPFNYKKLVAELDKAGVQFLVDRDRDSPHWGLRYVHGEIPAGFERFRSEEAKRSHLHCKAKRDRSNTLLKGAAAVEFRNRKGEWPLTVPDPTKDPEGYAVAVGAISEIGSAKLIDLVRYTEEKKREFENIAKMMAAGVREGKAVLEDRDRKRERYFEKLEEEGRNEPAPEGVGSRNSTERESPARSVSSAAAGQKKTTSWASHGQEKER